MREYPLRSVVRFGMVLGTLVLLAAPLAAQPAEKPAEDLEFPPLPLGLELGSILSFPDEALAFIAARIADGSATLAERRIWYRAADRYAPFLNPPVANWRARAVAVGDRLDVRRQRHASATAAPLSTIYLWLPLGPVGNYDVTPQYSFPGSMSQGRATAVWTDVGGNTNVILLGFADGGVWKTLDGGLHWQALTDFEQSLAIGAIDVLPGSAADFSDATIYVGTGEGNFSGPDRDGVGVLKSADGGATWALQTIPWQTDAVGIVGSHHIRRLRIDPTVANAQSVWIAADAGVYHTADGGASWSLVTGLPYTGAPAGAAFPGGCWNEFATDFTVDAADLVAGKPTLFAAFGRVQDAACAATPANARQNNGIYRSTDGGAVWTKVTLSGANGFPALPGNVGRVVVLSAPSNPKHLYVLLQNASSANFGKSLGIFSTADATASPVIWTARATTEFTNGQGWYDLTGAVNPADEDTVIVGGLDNYLSTDGAATLAKASNWSAGTAQWSHADHHHAVWADATTYYDANDGGFFIGTVPGAAAAAVTWQPRNGDTLATLQFYGLSQSATRPYQLNGGLQDNGHAFFDGSTWKMTFGGDGGFAATDQSDDAHAYEEYVYGAISHSTDGGATFAFATSCLQGQGTPPNACANCSIASACNPDGHTAFIAPFVLDPHNQNVMYTSSNFLWRNDNPRGGSKVWTKITSGLLPTADFVNASTSSRAYVNAIHIPAASPVAGSPARSQTIYLGTSTGRVWRTDDAGANWTDLTAAPLPVADMLTGRVVTAIDTDPADADRVVVTYSGFNGSIAGKPGHVFRSLDGGANWTDVSGALPDEPTNTIAVNPNAGAATEAFLGTDTGVYVDTGIWTTASWVKVNSGLLPNVAVNMLQWTAATTPRRLRAATHGRGMWELSVENGPVLTLDRARYDCTDTMQVTLQQPAGTPGPQSVRITSAAESAGEEIVLAEAPPGSGHFSAQVPVRGVPAVAGDGIVSVMNADTVTVSAVGGSLTASATVDCDACGTPPSGAPGPNLRLADAAPVVTPNGGDGDAFVDNCETATVTFGVENVGASALTNVRIASVVPSNPNVKITFLPDIATHLAACAQAPASLTFFANGLAPGEVLHLAVGVTSNELAAAGITRVLDVTVPNTEQDFVFAPLRTYSFEGDLQGWTVASGIFTRTNTGGGANGPASFYLASSAAQDLACDRARSPILRLSTTSTLTLSNQFEIEPPSPNTSTNAVESYDRANVALRDPTSAARTVIVPSGGRGYTASGPNGACVVAGEVGWNGAGPGWMVSSWTTAALRVDGAPGNDFAGRSVQIEVAYGTDSSASLAGFWFDEVTVTDASEQQADAQSNACSVPSCGLLEGSLCYHTVTPCRVLDTRSTSAPLVSNVARVVAVAGLCGVPASARAVAFNVTAVQPTGTGYINLYAAPPEPLTSTLNFNAGQTRASNTVIGLAPTDGTVSARCFVTGAGSVDLVLDVEGYFD